MVNDEIYQRSVEELEENACFWWPKEIQDKVLESSLLNLLLETQDQFLSILKLFNIKEPQNLFELLEAGSFPHKLFLKHLIVLSDFGGEPLQRINQNFEKSFTDKKMEFTIRAKSPRF